MTAEMVRTNIYLTEHHQQSFALLAQATGLTASEHIRRAADAYLTMHPPGKPQPLAPAPILDAEGYIHATLSSIEEDWQSCGDHDVRRLQWCFTAPTAQSVTYHFLWTGGRLIHSLYESPWEDGAVFQSIDDLFQNLDEYSLYTWLLVRLRVLTVADLTTHTVDPDGFVHANEDVIRRLDAFRTTFDVTSLVGTRCRYRLGLVRDLFFWREEGPEWPWPAKELCAAIEGPDVSTLELDAS